MTFIVGLNRVKNRSIANENRFELNGYFHVKDIELYRTVWNILVDLYLDFI